MFKALNQYKARIVSITLILLMLTLIVFLSIDLFPMLEEVVGHVSNEGAVVTELHGLGAEGVLTLIILQALQIITVVLPSVAVQILAGLAFGVFDGLLICLAGYLLGNTIIFVLMRQLRKVFSSILPDPDQKKKKSSWDFSFIREANNATILAFFLFLIPGVPNGILPYIFARTKITLPRYLLCILVAATPTIVLSSTMGARIAKGDFATAIVVAVLMLAMTLVVFFSRNRILSYLKNRGNATK